MTDNLSHDARSRNMAQVKARNTKPERVVRSQLHAMGYRFRLHRKDLPGHPDIVLPRHHKIIFVHGCFWHGHKGCRRAARPSTHKEFWNAKIDKNISRDEKVIAQLQQTGWQVLIIWECELRDQTVLRSILSDFMSLPPL